MTERIDPSRGDPIGGRSLYLDRSAGMICARCEKPTGNWHQGHYWGYCTATGRCTGFHFCCPDDCELENRE